MEYRLKGKEEKDILIDVILNIAENNLGRARKIRDPVTRHVVFLEKILTVHDALIGMLNSSTIEMSDNSRIRIKNLCNILNEEVESLLDWIQQPTYSPDHPVGNTIMKEANKDFDTHV